MLNVWDSLLCVFRIRPLAKELFLIPLKLSVRPQSGRPVPLRRSSRHDDAAVAAATAQRLFRFLLRLLHGRENCGLGSALGPVPSGSPSHVPPSRFRDEGRAPGVSTPSSTDGHVLRSFSGYGHQHNGLEKHVSGQNCFNHS